MERSRTPTRRLSRSYESLSRQSPCIRSAPPVLRQIENSLRYQGSSPAGLDRKSKGRYIRQVQYRRSIKIAKDKELQDDVARLIAFEGEAAFGVENRKPQPSIEPSEKNIPPSSRVIYISPKTLERSFAANESGEFDILPRCGRKRPGSLDVNSFGPVKRRQSLCVRPFRRSPSPKKYRISSSLWSPYGEEQSTADLFSPSNVSFTRSGPSAPPDWHDQSSPFGPKYWEEMHKTRVLGPSLQILLAKWEGYNKASGEGVRSYTDGADHYNPSSYASNQAGTTSTTTPSVTAINTLGGIERGGCGRGDDDDPRKPSKPYLKSTHDESGSSAVPSDDSEERRRKIAVRKGKRRMSSNSVPVLDKDLLGEDSGDLDDTYDPGRDMTLTNQAVAAHTSLSNNSPSSKAPESSRPGPIPSLARLANNTAPPDGVTVDTEHTGDCLVDRLDTLGASSPPRAHTNENERLRRHSIATPTIEQPALTAEPARRPSMLERYLEHGHPRAGTPHPSIALEGAGRQSGMPTSAELDGRVRRSMVPGADGRLGPIDIIPIGRVSEASDSSSRDAAFPGPPGHRRHSAGRLLSCSVDQGANDTTEEDHRGRSRLCGLSASHADVCEESQSRPGWRASEQVPASVITGQQPAHPPWIDEKRPKQYLSKLLDASVGYGPYPNSPRSSRSGVPSDQTQGDIAPAAEEPVLTSNIPAEPPTVTSIVHTPANTVMMADPDDITTEHYEQALSPEARVAATTDVPSYQLEDPPRYQLQDPSSPTSADTQVVDGIHEAVVGTSSQVASQTGGSNSSPDVGLRNTQVVDFAHNLSMNSRDIALPRVNRVPFDSDENWGLGTPSASMTHVERVRRSSHTGPWARPAVVMNTGPRRPSSSELATAWLEINAVGPDVGATASATGANTTVPESTTSERTQNADRVSRRRASTIATNRRRSFISYLLPCLNTNDAETARSNSDDRGRQNDRSIFGSFSTINDPARQSIYELRPYRSRSRSPAPMPEAVVGGGHDDAHDASTDPGTTGPWLTP